MALVSRPIKKSGLAATILVVDDEDLIRKIIYRMLQPMGYDILHAANGTEALTICEQWKGAIHLMVTDVTMPGMNGIDLVDCATERWPSIKILFITGFATDAAIPRRTGAEITEPIDDRHLILYFCNACLRGRTLHVRVRRSAITVSPSGDSRY